MTMQGTYLLYLAFLPYRMIILKSKEKCAELLHLKKRYSSSKMYQPCNTESECFLSYIKILTELREIKDNLRPSQMHAAEEQGMKREFM